MKKILIVAAPVIVIAAAIVVIVIKAPKPGELAIDTPPAVDIKTLAVFSQPIDADTIGFTSFSPDGNYFFYSAYTNGGNPANNAHVVNLRTGDDKALNAMASRGFKGDDVLALFTETKLSIYDASADKSVVVSENQNTSDAFVSNDGTWVVVNGDKLTAKNLRTDEVKTLDAKSESAGFAWFSDDNRILGFKENSKNLFEAGKGRDLGIWNVKTGEFTKIPITFPVKSIRYIEWLEQDHIARVNAGYDDGSYDYLVDVDNNKLIDFGETSWALMGGIVTDSSLGVMAAIGSGGAGDCTKYNECNGFVADKTGKISEFKLPRDKHRSGLQIISKTKLMYISRDLGEEGGYGTTYIATYDTETKQETRLQEVPNMNIVALSLSPDKKIWIVGAGKEFIVREVK